MNDRLEMSQRQSPMSDRRREDDIQDCDDGNAWERVRLDPVSIESISVQRELRHIKTIVPKKVGSQRDASTKNP